MCSDKRTGPLELCRLEKKDPLSIFCHARGVLELLSLARTSLLPLDFDSESGWRGAEMFAKQFGSTPSVDRGVEILDVGL